MKYILLQILLLTTASASAEIIHLDCPTSREDFYFFNHRWVLDLDNMQATLFSEHNPWLEPGRHKIFKVTDGAILVVKNTDNQVFWEIDRYTLASSVIYENSGRGYILSDRCNISDKKF